jgi:hypothetical protein
MPHSLDKSARAKLMRTGRMTENRDTPAGQYRAQRADYPNQSEFSKAEYVDPAGRRYRAAFASKLTLAPGQPVRPLSLLERRAAILKRGDGLVRLWVKLPRASKKRPSGKFTAADCAARTVLDLMPVKAGLQRQVCQLVSTSAIGPKGRGDSIYVSGFVVE